VGYAEDITIDAAGRLLVSQSLRDFASLDKDVMLVGQGSHFEMWNLGSWRKQLELVMGNTTIEMPAELEGFSL
jgi:MraZ protein